MRGERFASNLDPPLRELVRTNTAFYEGRQWEGLPDTPAMRRLPKPVFNITKRVVSLFIASLTSTKATVSVEVPGDEALSAFATEEIEKLFSFFGMEYRLRDALLDGAISGDYCAHMFYEPGRPRGQQLRFELLDGANVIFANPRLRDIQEQEYIILTCQAKASFLRCENPEATSAPDDAMEIYFYVYEKYGGRVYVSKATKTAMIYEGVDTGLSLYPVAWGNWERRKRCFHGGALITSIIPNQIYINTMFAMVMRHLQLMGFPKTVYNADYIRRWTNEVGEAVGIHGLPPGAPLGNIAAHLSPGEASGQILLAIDKAMQYTKDCLGATDVALANVRPDNTSAILVLQQQANVPLENIRAGLYEWLRDVARILLDMQGAYFGRRDGFDYRVFSSLLGNVKIHAGAGNYWSEIAALQTLDNLRKEGAISIAEYLERLPGDMIPMKEELINSIKNNIQKEETWKKTS